MWRSMAGELYLKLWKDEDKGLKLIYAMSDVGGKGLVEIKLLLETTKMVESYLGKEDTKFRNLAKEKYPFSCVFIPDQSDSVSGGSADDPKKEESNEEPADSTANKNVGEAVAGTSSSSTD